MGVLPEELLRTYEAMPYAFGSDGVLHVALSDPETAERLRGETAIRLEFAVAPRDQIIEHFATLASAVDAARWEVDEVVIAGDSAETGATSAPAVSFVSSTLATAISRRASDLHFVPHDNSLMIRARIDGMLVKVGEVASTEAPTIISRLKVIGKLDIAEHRHAQDGRASLRTRGGRLFDARIAILPTIRGEGAIVRLLETTRPAPTLAAVGMSDQMQLDLERLLKRPQGALIVTGPTGSGKTTTLYAALADLLRPEINVVTIEDPVEYGLLGAYQIQIDGRANGSFASTLRSVLRADPDIIMVGEVRDQETAKMAMSAAMTGHRCTLRMLRRRSRVSSSLESTALTSGQR
jgi:type IV pilus assembly protein PilB